MTATGGGPQQAWRRVAAAAGGGVLDITDGVPTGARVHLIGVGGAGMSALASILLQRGHEVSGSDLRAGRAVAALRALGADVGIGHRPDAVDRSDIVAASAAIPASDPELRRAVDTGRPVLRRVQLLAALMAGHDRLVVGGVHGKTTTASMATVCLQTAGIDPSFVLGGTLHDAGASAHHGSGRWFVTQADPLATGLDPDIATLTTSEGDAAGPDGGDGDPVDAVLAFARRRRDGGVAVLPHDDVAVATALARIDGAVATFGEHPGATLRIVDVALHLQGASFGLVHRGEDVGRFEISLPGRHNVVLAAAAALSSALAGAGWDGIRRGLAIFAGAGRRFERLGVAAGVVVVDDYGNRPASLRAALAAARQTAPDGRVIAVFQPHGFTRTAQLGAALGAALVAADTVIVTDVYGAGEQPVAGVTGELVATAAREAGADVHYVASVADVPARVLDLVESGDLVLTLGAGDITEVGPVVLRRLRGGRA